MVLSKVYSAQTEFLHTRIIEVEVDISYGLNAFSLVGLPDKSLEEARDRISAAIKNSGYKSPKNKNQKVVISLAPAEIRKEGSSYDLAMAIAYLFASEYIEFDPSHTLFLGELALSGDLRPIQGSLSIAEEARKRGFTQIFLPQSNAVEAALIDGIAIFGATSLKEVVDHINVKPIPEPKADDEPETIHELLRQRKIFEPIPVQEKTKIIYKENPIEINFSHIKGQEIAKRGLEIAASGNHNIALYGPPGTGKTMLAKAFCYILPDLTFEEILETTKIHSISRKPNISIDQNDSLILYPPFRSPHHTSSYISMIGGGAIPKPGEVTLSHRGVLFADEFTEFDRKVIDSLRQPLEERAVTITRAKGVVTFPANFIFIAAMNLCPCGNTGIKIKKCLCKPFQKEQYLRKISGPIVDRIDLWIEVSEINYNKLTNANDEESSEIIKERVLKTRNIQCSRFDISKTNSEMNSQDISKHIKLEETVKTTLNTAAEKLNFSSRSYYRVLKLAQTIADMEGNQKIENKHILEALQYRPKQPFL
jgi:magnesium chelatase family protein